MCLCHINRFMGVLSLLQRTAEFLHICPKNFILRGGGKFPDTLCHHFRSITVFLIIRLPVFFPQFLQRYLSELRVFPHQLFPSFFSQFQIIRRIVFQSPSRQYRAALIDKMPGRILFIQKPALPVFI